MADEKKNIVFKVDIDNDDFLKEAAKTRKLLKDLKDQQKALDTSTEEGAKAYEQYEAAIKVTAEEVRKLTDLQKAKLKFNKAEEGSNKQLREALKILTAQYNELSQEQRETTEEGRLLGDQISEITAKLKENESAVGDNRRNVGNYKESIIEANAEIKRNTAFTSENRDANIGLRSQMEASAESFSAIAGTFTLLSTLTRDNERAQAALEKITILVTAATVASNLAKAKGQILDTAAFVKTKALTVVQAAYNAVINSGTVALNVFKVALAGLGIGAVIAGISLLISKMQKQKEATSDAADEQERFNDELDTTAALFDRQRQVLTEIEEKNNLQNRALQRNIELRKAQGASDVEIQRLEVELLEKRARQLEALRGSLEFSLLSQKDQLEIIEDEKDLVNDLTIARIELNKALAEEAELRRELEAQRQASLTTADQEAIAVQQIQTITAQTAEETQAAIDAIFERQREQMQQRREDLEAQRQSEIESLQQLAQTAQAQGQAIGAAFADSIDEAGFKVEDFARRLALLSIDALERSLLAAIAEITFKEIASKGFGGIVTSGILAAIVTGAANTAKAALSKPVKFEHGGEYAPFEVGGKLHSQGGTKYYGEDGNVIEMERGEKIFVTNRRASAFIGAVAEINKAFGGRGLTGSSSFLQDGGFASRSASSEVNGRFAQAQMVADIVRGLPNPVVSVSEINAVQNSVRTVQAVTSL